MKHTHLLQDCPLVSFCFSLPLCHQYSEQSLCYARILQECVLIYASFFSLDQLFLLWNYFPYSWSMSTNAYQTVRRTQLKDLVFMFWIHLRSLKIFFTLTNQKVWPKSHSDCWCLHLHQSVISFFEINWTLIRCTQDENTAFVNMASALSSYALSFADLYRSDSKIVRKY